MRYRIVPANEQATMPFTVWSDLPPDAITRPLWRAWMKEPDDPDYAESEIWINLRYVFLVRAATTS